MTRRFALLTGGGTAGHLQPALAIAEALVEAGHAHEELEFVASQRGPDATVLDGRGFPVTLLPGRGVVRGLGFHALTANARALVDLARATARARGVLARSNPAVVVAVGGYASLATSLAAIVRRVPLVLVNIDAVPGAANRLLGRFATASLVGWEGCRLPHAVVTGTPVRSEIAAVERDPASRRAARALLGLPVDRPTVVAFGGSLGARSVNLAIDGLVEGWKDRTDRSLVHIVGRRDWTERDRPDPDHGLALVRVPYEERMAVAYAAADLVVCRAGAMSVAELAATGTPSVLVPLPGAPGDHQTANARVLERSGGARLLPDQACDGATLADLVDTLLDTPGALDTMGRAAASLGRPDAALAGARVIEEAGRQTAGRGTGHR